MAISKPKLLIVEDDISSQQYYSVVLRELFDLSIASTVEQAKQALADEKFELALVDISLPGDEDGIDLIKFIRSEYTNSLPALAISAHAFPRNREEALAAGAVDFFTKPIMSAVLMEIIQKYIPKT
ncbi:MAG: response regulator [Candidatus Marinimicrobia bacterium]|nr:response regulator [Candidatus Neomarinimicrobiota bacterium]